MRTQVAIIGAGPAGLLLSHLLHLQGIDSVVLERRGRAYVEQRLRAGVLEHGTAETLREAGVGKNMDENGLVHGGIRLHFAGQRHRVDFDNLAGRGVTVYGQHMVVRDLIAARLEAAGDLRFEVDNVSFDDLDSERPRVTFTHGGSTVALDCDFVVGADGFHGVCRSLLPGLRTVQRAYPFAWLGILAESEPACDELVYARHERGFALQSMRSPTISRMYLQVAADEDVSRWPDDRIWAELHERLDGSAGETVAEGPVLDKAVTPMRSFVATSMQYGRLFLVGDAAHIVPPTGAKGMNLAVADVRLLSRAIGGFCAAGRTDLLASYTTDALRRVWQATHFSWWMTSMLHVDPTDDGFGAALALAQLEQVVHSRSTATVLAESYTGLPFAAGWSYS